MPNPFSRLFLPDPNDYIISDDSRRGGITGNLPSPFPEPNNPFGNVQFGPSNSPDMMSQVGQNQNIPMPTDMPQTEGKSMLEEFTPDTYYSDLFKKEYLNRPERPNPGKANRIITGILSGLAGKPEAANEILYGNYNRELDDWKTRLSAINPGLQAERYANTNERTIINQSEGRRLEQKRLDLATKTATEKQDLAERKQQLAELKQQNPSYKFETGEDGFVYAIDEKDPTKSIKTPVKSGELSEFDKVRLNLSASLTKIDAQADANKALEEVRALNRQDIANLNRDTQILIAQTRAELAGQNKWSAPQQAFDRENKPMPYMITTNGVTGEIKTIPLPDGSVTRTTPPGSSSTTESETQKRAGMVNKAMEVINQHPEWKMYIDIDSTGVTVKPVGTGMFSKDLTRETRNQILAAIGVPSVKDETKPKSEDIKPKSPTPTKGRVIVEDKNGKRYSLPEGQLAQAIAQGYKEVK